MESASIKPLVSVVTPSFNQAQFIEETMASVLRQDYRPLEHIVIDAASTDGTVGILQRWSAEHNSPQYQLKWISEPDRGMGEGVNKGFARASGEIVGWLNSDDVYFDRFSVTAAVNALQAKAEIDAVYGDVALISEDGGLWMMWCFPKFKYPRVLRGYSISQPTIFFRRRVTDEIRIDPDLPVARMVAPDVYMWLAAGSKYRFQHLNRVQAADRDHSTRLTHAVADKWRERRDEMYRAFGRSKPAGFWLRAADQVTRAAMRLKGAIHLALLFSRPGWQKDLAFPMWVDGRRQVLHRQATMRILRRPQLVRPDSAKPKPVRIADKA